MTRTPHAFAAAKLAHCAACIDSDEESRDLDDRANRRIWQRLADEARGDALYWAVELYLAGGWAVAL